MYCSKCGKELIKDAKFCDSCGTQVEQSLVNKTPVSTLTDNTNKTIEDASSNTGAEINAKTSSKKKTIFKVLLALGGGIVLLAIIISIFKEDEPIQISNISYETGWIDNIDLSMDITNTSNKDISYVYIDTYAYDRMASELAMETLKYTGPFKSGESYSVSWEDLFYESGVYAVWPRDVKVVYINGGETTFENSLYCYKEGFYSEGLK